MIIKAKGAIKSIINKNVKTNKLILEQNQRTKKIFNAARKCY